MYQSSAQLNRVETKRFTLTVNSDGDGGALVSLTVSCLTLVLSGVLQPYRCELKLTASTPPLRPPVRHPEAPG